MLPSIFLAKEANDKSYHAGQDNAYQRVILIAQAYPHSPAFQILRRMKLREHLFGVIFTPQSPEAPTES